MPANVRNWGPSTIYIDDKLTGFNPLETPPPNTEYKGIIAYTSDMKYNNGANLCERAYANGVMPRVFYADTGTSTYYYVYKECAYTPVTWEDMGNNAWNSYATKAWGRLSLEASRSVSSINLDRGSISDLPGTRLGDERSEEPIRPDVQEPDGTEDIENGTINIE